jgi:hypothetical protein
MGAPVGNFSIGNDGHRGGRNVELTQRPVRDVCNLRIRKGCKWAMDQQEQATKPPSHAGQLGAQREPGRMKPANLGHGNPPELQDWMTLPEQQIFRKPAKAKESRQIWCVLGRLNFGSGQW